MAQVFPELPHPAARGGLRTELDVVEALGAGLPEEFCVFHGVEWTATDGGARAFHGEVDVVVVDAAGDLLLIEVKAGALREGADGALHKRYEQGRRDVLQQLRSQFGVVRARLKAAGLDELRVEQLLVLPHHRLREDNSAWPRERIVDSSRIGQLPALARQLLGAGAPRPQLRERLLRLLRRELQLEPDVSALADRVGQTVTRLSSGLAQWVPRISAPAGLIKVVGTAGSGKTQLALRLLRETCERGGRAGYVCFNRPLADHMARLCPPAVQALTFHELALELCRAAGETIDFAQPGVFDHLARRCAALAPGRAPDLDLLVIDELQDFQPEWVQTLGARLVPEGRMLLLEDPNQRLYTDRDEFALPEAVVVRSMDNFRSPRQICRLINALQLAAEPVVAAGPWQGELPQPLTYDGDDPTGCLRATEEAVARCIERGYAPRQIAVVTLAGLQRSKLTAAGTIGAWTTQRFAGYDAAGRALWHAGELLVDTVWRFKGQAAPAVVLTECEFERLDLLARRKLFVGMTRARLHLEWVLSERAAAAVGEALQNEG
jgi:hypothetical protein